MNNAYYLANVFCAAQYLLGDINTNYRGKKNPYLIKQEERAKEVIDPLLNYFKKNNYNISAIIVNNINKKDLTKSEFQEINIDEQNKYDIGLVYFNFNAMGVIRFKHNDDKEQNFNINYDSPRIISGKFENHEAYNELIRKINIALNE